MRASRFVRGLSASLVAIDGTWRRECTVIDTSASSLMGDRPKLPQEIAVGKQFSNRPDVYFAIRRHLSRPDSASNALVRLGAIEVPLPKPFKRVIGCYLGARITCSR